jgi:hypothetical protein
MIDLVHLNARTDFTRRATKTFMLGRNLAQFNDCVEGICKIDDKRPANFNYTIVSRKPEEELTLTPTCSATVFHMRQKNCLKIYNFSRGNI